MLEDTIEEIKEDKSPSPSLSEEIDKEMRKSRQEVHINLTQMIQTPSTQNIISFAQGQTNDLTKIKRRLLYCFKYLASILPSKFSSSNPKPLTSLGKGAFKKILFTRIPRKSMRSKVENRTMHLKNHEILV